MDGGAACGVFHGVVQAADQPEAHAQIKYTNNEAEEDGSNYAKFYCGRAAIVAPYCGEVEFRHTQSNRIQAVLVIVLGNVLAATVMPAKSGVYVNVVLMLI